MTQMGRGAALICTMTGNIGKFGTGCHTWSGNYKAGGWTATPWSGAGLAVHTGEDPFNLTLDAKAHGKEIKTKSYYYGEEVGFWNHGDTALIVNTPKYGRKVFTGKTHMPTPSKFRWVTNVNVLNNAKHHYDMVKNVDPNIEMYYHTGYRDDVGCQPCGRGVCVQQLDGVYLSGNDHDGLQSVGADLEGRHRPLYDTRNDADTFAGAAAKLTEITGDARMKGVFHFVYQNRVDVYPQRMLDASSTYYGYNVDTMLKSEKGWMVMVRTYPRHPLWEETNKSKPQWTRSGRIETYRIEPEAIEYGENFVVHREGTEATRICPTRFSPRIRTSGRTTTGFRSPRSIMTTSTCGT